MSRFPGEFRALHVIITDWAYNTLIVYWIIMIGQSINYIFCSCCLLLTFHLWTQHNSNRSTNYPTVRVLLLVIRYISLSLYLIERRMHSQTAIIGPHGAPVDWIFVFLSANLQCWLPKNTITFIIPSANCRQYADMWNEFIKIRLSNKLKTRNVYVLLSERFK